MKTKLSDKPSFARAMRPVLGVFDGPETFLPASYVRIVFTTVYMFLPRTAESTSRLLRTSHCQMNSQQSGEVSRRPRALNLSGR